MINSNLSQHYKGYESLIAKLDEAIRLYEKTYRCYQLDFLKPDEIRIAESYLGNKVAYSLIGGYDEALSKRLVIGEVSDEKEYVSLLKAKFNSKFIKISHPDVKGALYNLGIEPNKFGDFWVEEGAVYLYVASELAYSICYLFTAIGHNSIEFNVEEQYKAQNFNYSAFQITVSSYRLDKIVSCLIKKSREKAKVIINGALVNVNYQTIEDCDFMCHNNDILSLRGFGRFKIGEEVATTKSGNVIIEVKKYV